MEYLVLGGVLGLITYWGFTKFKKASKNRNCNK